MYRLGAKVPKKKPDVSAYNNGVPPHPMEARSTKQVHGSKKQSRAQKQLIWLSKKIPWVQHKYMQIQKKFPHRVQKTHKQPTFFVTLGSKKNQVRSKKHLQVQKKGAQVQKTCIPYIYIIYIYILNSGGYMSIDYH